MNFFRAPFFLSWLYPQLTWRVETSAKELYLTFDDGPIPGPTEFVLDELRKRKAHATFFCIGENVTRHPQLFNRVVEEGHAIGNHTFNHLSGWKVNNDDYLKNIEQCSHTIDEFTPFSPRRRAGLPAEALAKVGDEFAPFSPRRRAGLPAEALAKVGDEALFRPPYGRITRNQIKSLTGYKIVMWEVLTHDYAQNLSSARCLKGSIGAARPGSIVVFHDSLKAEKNMTYVLPRFMEHFANLGYSFKSLH